MNKQKICIMCPQELRGSKRLFCSRRCYAKANLHLANEKAYLERIKESVDLEAEILYVKKHNLILKESVNFDVPFIRIQEERYSKKIDKNEGIVLPEDSDVIEIK